MVAVMRSALIRVALASAVLAGAFSSSAVAETICVNFSSAGCSSPQESQISPALARAATLPGIDTVQIGPGEYATEGVSGFSYASPDPVRVLGAGIGRTVLRSGVETPEHVLSLSVPLGAPTAETSVTGLSVLAGHLMGGGSAALLSGQVADSEFTAIGTENVMAFALSVTEGSTVSRVQAASFGPSAVAIGAVGDVTISDSLVHATIGITLAPGGQAGVATVQRTRLLTSQEGLDICNTTAVAEDVAIQISGGAGVNIEGSSRCTGAGSLFTGRNLTITGSGAENGGVGLQASANTTNPSVVLTDSILWELANAIRAQPLLGKTTILHLGRLAEDPLSSRSVARGRSCPPTKGGTSAIRSSSTRPMASSVSHRTHRQSTPASPGRCCPVNPRRTSKVPPGPRMGTAMELPGGTSERSRAPPWFRSSNPKRRFQI